MLLFIKSYRLFCLNSIKVYYVYKICEIFDIYTDTSIFTKGIFSSTIIKNKYKNKQ